MAHRLMINERDESMTQRQREYVARMKRNDERCMVMLYVLFGAMCFTTIVASLTLIICK